MPGTVVAATEALILAHDPAWAGAGGSGIYPDWLQDMAVAVFGLLETVSIDMAQPSSHAAWRGRIRASAGIAASLNEDVVARFGAALAEMLGRDYPDDTLRIPHRVWLATGLHG